MTIKMTIKKSLSLICVFGILCAMTGEYASAFDFEEHGVDKTDFIYDTEFDGVKSSADGELVAVETNAAGNEVYIPADLVEVDLTKDIAPQIADFDLPQEIIDAITAKAAIVDTLEDKRVVIMAPQNNQESSSGDNGDISTCGWTYDNYNGTPVKNYKLYSYSLNGKTLEFKGSSAKTKASAMISLALTAASQASKSISYATTAKSILDDFCSIFGIKATDIQGGSNDYVEHTFKYDIVEQYTYAQQGQIWKYCYYSQKVTINSVRVEVYFFIQSTRTGKEKIYTRNTSITQTSANFNSPYAKAISNLPYYGSEYVSWKVAGTTYKFASTAAPAT